MKPTTLHSALRLRHRRRPFPVTVFLLAGSAALTVGIGAASATPSHWETYEYAYGPEISFCGDLQQEGVVTGRFRTTTHGPDGFYYEHDIARFTDTWTNLETAEFVTTEGSYRNDAHRVTDNGDGTLTILVQGSGTTATFNEAGERIAFGAGLTAWELLIDHAGTPTDPSDDEVLAFLGFTKSTGVDDGMCSAILEEIG